MRFITLLLLFLLVTVLAVPQGSARAEFLTEADRARLQAEYDKIQAEIAEWERVLADTRSKKASLQGDVDTLNALINKASAEIRERSVTITRITNEIALKEATIQELEEKLLRGHASLSKMLRIKNEADGRSLAEIVLSSDDLTAFFGDLDQLAVVQQGLQELFAEVRILKNGLLTEKEALAERQDRELDARYEVEATKREIAKNEAAKKELLTIAKTEEKTYQQVLAERQRRAEQIRNALFPLRDVEGISFSVALDYATAAEKATGVRAALILAVLSQESDLGKNVGNCYVTDLSTGDGVGKNTGKVFAGIMKVPRDTVPFERITDALGREWSITPVSCPLPGGYGGAMGPTQFIPSTWELFEGRLKTTLKISATDPWNPQHAIMATALYLEDVGASAGGYTAEHRAAARYYAGSGWATRGQSYGNSVIAKAETFQEDIDFLKGI